MASRTSRCERETFAHADFKLGSTVVAACQSTNKVVFKSLWRGPAYQQLCSSANQSLGRKKCRRGLFMRLVTCTQAQQTSPTMGRPLLHEELLAGETAQLPTRLAQPFTSLPRFMSRIGASVSDVLATCFLLRFCVCPQKNRRKGRSLQNNLASNTSPHIPWLFPGSRRASSHLQDEHQVRSG